MMTIDVPNLSTPSGGVDLNGLTSFLTQVAAKVEEIDDNGGPSLTDDGTGLFTIGT